MEIVENKFSKFDFSTKIFRQIKSEVALKMYKLFNFWLCRKQWKLNLKKLPIDDIN